MALTPPRPGRVAVIIVVVVEGVRARARWRFGSARPNRLAHARPSVLGARERAGMKVEMKYLYPFLLLTSGGYPDAR